jgi:hypothetical protein
MFNLQLSLSQSVVEALKAGVRLELPQVQSTHRVEALARGLGFKTYAAMLSAASSGGNPRNLDHAAFCGFLESVCAPAGPRALYRTAARATIRSVMETEPQLTRFGIGIYDQGGRNHDGTRETPAQWRTRFDENRRSLIDAPEDFLRALALVQQLRATKTITDTPSSYGLKHKAEQLPSVYPDGSPLGPGYVANGSLIAAAAYAGFRLKKYPLSPNVQFNISKRSLDQVFDGLKARAA